MDKIELALFLDSDVWDSAKQLAEALDLAGERAVAISHEGGGFMPTRFVFEFGSIEMAHEVNEEMVALCGQDYDGREREKACWMKGWER